MSLIDETQNPHVNIKINTQVYKQSEFSYIIFLHKKFDKFELSYKSGTKQKQRQNAMSKNALTFLANFRVKNESNT